MAEKKVFKDYAAIIKAVVILAVGILFCLSTAMGTKVLSILFGAGLILCGAVAILLTFLDKKSLLTLNGILGSASLALGILAIIDNIAGILLAVIPWILIALGALVIVDTLLLIFWRKEKRKLIIIVQCILGIALLTLGICLLTIDSFKRFAGIVLGVALIVYAIYSLTGEISINVKKKD